MKPGFVAPRGTLDLKPKHGQPCNRCGLCCYAVLCPLAQFIFKHELGPCPALTGTIGDAGCGLVQHPMKYAMRQTLAAGEQKMRDAALLLIGSNTGCDARLNGEPGDEAFYARLREIDRRTHSQARSARKLWGMPR